MSKAIITDTRIMDHVRRLGDLHPPVALDSVDRTIKDPAGVRDRFARVLDYMARVEMEVERNVLELVVLLPGVDEVNRTFYQDVWQPQELHHGLILDRLQQDLEMPAATPDLTTISPRVRVLGALSHLSPVQEVIKMLYYLTGAATERSAVLAYAKMHKGLLEMGEDAIASTIIAPIKVQEPGHFAFYKLSATHLAQSGALAPWQMHLTRFLRSRTFGLVGAKTPAEKAGYGAVAADLGFEDDLHSHARDIARVETQLLWAKHEGLDVPDYVLASFREALELHRARA